MRSNNKPSECRIFAKRLSRYADGDLRPAEAAEAKHHLESCPRCAAALESHNKMILLLESGRELEPPWDLEVKVLEAVGFGGPRTQLRGYRVPPPIIWAGGVAAMALLGLAGLALKAEIPRVLSLIFGQAGSLSSGELAGLAGRITRYLVTVWDGLLASLGILRPLARTVGAVSEAAGGNPMAMGAAACTLALLFLFFRMMTAEKKSRATTEERRPHVNR